MIPASLNLANASNQPTAGSFSSVNPDSLSFLRLSCRSNESHQPTLSSCLLPARTPHVKAFGRPFSAKTCLFSSMYSPGFSASSSPPPLVGPMPTRPNQPAIVGHSSSNVQGGSRSAVLRISPPHLSGFRAAYSATRASVLDHTGDKSDLYPASDPGNGTCTISSGATEDDFPVPCLWAYNERYCAQ